MITGPHPAPCFAVANPWRLPTSCTHRGGEGRCAGAGAVARSGMGLRVVYLGDACAPALAVELPPARAHTNMYEVTPGQGKQASRTQPQQQGSQLMGTGATADGNSTAG